MDEQGLDIRDVHNDAGVMVYDLNKQQVGAGASGCACSAVVTLGQVQQDIIQNKYKRVLVVSTGALHSPRSCNQGENIPSIAHAVMLER